MSVTNPYAANPIDPLFNGGHSSRVKNALDSLRGDTVARIQTIFTPQCIVEPVSELFGGQIQFDPVWAPFSLTNPVAKHEAPWARIWTRVHKLVTEHGLSSSECNQLYALIRSEIRAKNIKNSKLRAQLSKLSREIRETIRSEFKAQSGHAIEWPDGTFINPPFGDKGPETILATFQDFIKRLKTVSNEVVMLGPVRSQRSWWRDAVLSCDAVTYMNTIKFFGEIDSNGELQEYKQAFPAPLFLAYKGPRPDRAAQCFAHLGDTYAHGKL